MERKRVLITYAWNRIAYVIMRSLASKGIEVYAGDSSPLAMARASKFCRGFFRYPSFYRDPIGFVESVLSYCKKNKIAVYFPVHEETFVVSRFINRFEEEGVIVPVTEFSRLLKIHRKDTVIEHAKNLNIPVPTTYIPKTFHEAEKLLNYCPYPLVIKQINTNSAKGVFYARSKNEAMEILKKIQGNRGSVKSAPPIFQEYVSGSGYGVSLLFNRGELRAFFTHKRLREKTYTGGTSTLRVATRNSVLEEYAIRLLKSLKWHGVAMVEFKYNEDEGKAWLLEVNPRFWGSLALPVASGVDFPYLLYKIVTDGDVPPLSDYKTGIKAKWILGDILAAIDEFKHTGNLLKSAFRFFRFNCDVYDDFRMDDPMPFVFEVLYYIHKFLATRSVNPVRDALLEVDKLCEMN